MEIWVARVLIILGICVVVAVCFLFGLLIHYAIKSKIDQGYDTIKYERLRIEIAEMRRYCTEVNPIIYDICSYLLKDKCRDGITYHDITNFRGYLIRNYLGNIKYVGHVQSENKQE